MNFTLKRTDSADPDFSRLTILLDKDLAIRDGDDHAFYAQFNKIASINNAIVCYDGDHAVGCGGFKPFEEDMVEIKRMFVMPECRGQGIALKILSSLEEWAATSGYKKAVLETGVNQPEAINLYGKAGYHRIENYGQYKNVVNSVCMQKDL